jgi:PAS domain S-box-containing protein
VFGLIVATGGLSSPYYSLIFIVLAEGIIVYGLSGIALELAAQAMLAFISWWVAPNPSQLIPIFITSLVVQIVVALILEQYTHNSPSEQLLPSSTDHSDEVERQRLLSLINSLSLAVLATDAQGKVFLYNAAALEILDTNTDIAGRTLTSLIRLKTDTGRHINPLHLAQASGHPTNRQDVSFIATDGSTIRLDLTISPVRTFGHGDHTLQGYIVVLRDITKQKSLDEERDEFTSVISHELRTPLAIAEANVSTALLPSFGEIPPRAKRLIEQAHENIIFLSELIADLTTLSRAERGDLKVSLEIVDIAELFHQLEADYRDQAQAKHLHLVLNLGSEIPKIMTGRHELHEILQNFLTNAIKYTPAGSITLTAAYANNAVTMSVTDTGIGLATTDQKRLFEKFYRSEDFRTRATGGTGLGLYITKKLAAKLGAEISFQSRLNHGSTFAITIPPADHDVRQIS